jgi:putative ubiquitin-RnfH superfamily antitoxin RatB of RatAB toxin-antitoxin module
MLNLSVFYYEILHLPDRACIVAKAACDDAHETGIFSKRKSPEDEEEQKEAIEIYTNICLNLRRWTNQLVPHVS